MISKAIIYELDDSIYVEIVERWYTVTSTLGRILLYSRTMLNYLEPIKSSIYALKCSLRAGSTTWKCSTKGRFGRGWISALYLSLNNGDLSKSVTCIPKVMYSESLRRVDSFDNKCYRQTYCRGLILLFSFIV